MASSLQEFAEQAVAGLLQDSALSSPYSELTSAEVVEVVGEGPGILMLWEQRRTDHPAYTFGLLMSATALIAEQEGTYGGEAVVETSAMYLRLAVDEPHAGADGVRTWFRALP